MKLPEDDNSVWRSEKLEENSSFSNLDLKNPTILGTAVTNFMLKADPNYALYFLDTLNQFWLAQKAENNREKIHYIQELKNVKSDWLAGYQNYIFYLMGLFFHRTLDKANFSILEEENTAKYDEVIKSIYDRLRKTNSLEDIFGKMFGYVEKIMPEIKKMRNEFQKILRNVGPNKDPSFMNIPLDKKSPGFTLLRESLTWHDIPLAKLGLSSYFHDEILPKQNGAEKEGERQKKLTYREYLEYIKSINDNPQSQLLEIYNNTSKRSGFIELFAYFEKNALPPKRFFWKAKKIEGGAIAFKKEKNGPSNMDKDLRISMTITFLEVISQQIFGVGLNFGNLKKIIETVLEKNLNLEVNSEKDILLWLSLIADGRPFSWNKKYYNFSFVPASLESDTRLRLFEALTLLKGAGSPYAELADKLSKQNEIRFLLTDDDKALFIMNGARGSSLSRNALIYDSDFQTVELLISIPEDNWNSSFKRFRKGASSYSGNIACPAWKLIIKQDRKNNIIIYDQPFEPERTLKIAAESFREDFVESTGLEKPDSFNLYKAIIIDQIKELMCQVLFDGIMDENNLGLDMCDVKRMVQISTSLRGVMDFDELDEHEIIVFDKKTWRGKKLEEARLKKFSNRQINLGEEEKIVASRNDVSGPIPAPRENDVWKDDAVALGFHTNGFGKNFITNFFNRAKPAGLKLFLTEFEKTVATATSRPKIFGMIVKQILERDAKNKLKLTQVYEVPDSDVDFLKIINMGEEVVNVDQDFLFILAQFSQNKEDFIDFWQTDDIRMCKEIKFPFASIINYCKSFLASLPQLAQKVGNKSILMPTETWVNLLWLNLKYIEYILENGKKFEPLAAMLTDIDYGNLRQGINFIENNINDIAIFTQFKKTNNIDSPKMRLRGIITHFNSIMAKESPIIESAHLLNKEGFLKSGAEKEKIFLEIIMTLLFAKPQNLKVCESIKSIYEANKEKIMGIMSRPKNAYTFFQAVKKRGDVRGGINSAEPVGAVYTLLIMELVSDIIENLLSDEKNHALVCHILDILGFFPAILQLNIPPQKIGILNKDLIELLKNKFNPPPLMVRLRNFVLEITQKGRFEQLLDEEGKLKINWDQ